MLTCVTAKGLMNRAHALQGGRWAENVGPIGQGPRDKGVTMGLFCSCAILIWADGHSDVKATRCPVQPQGSGPASGDWPRHRCPF